MAAGLNDTLMEWANIVQITDEYEVKSKNRMRTLE